MDIRKNVNQKMKFQELNRDGEYSSNINVLLRPFAMSSFFFSLLIFENGKSSIEVFSRNGLPNNISTMVKNLIQIDYLEKKILNSLISTSKHYLLRI